MKILHIVLHTDTKQFDGNAFFDADTKYQELQEKKMEHPQKLLMIFTNFVSPSRIKIAQKKWKDRYSY